VLVVRLSSLGDIVLTEPVTAALRRERPGCEIGFVVKDRFRDIVAGQPAVSTIHALSSGSLAALAALCRDVRSRRYAAVVDLHANARSRIVSAAALAPVVSVYRKRDPGDWLSVRVARRPFRARVLTVDRYLAALTKLGVEPRRARPSFRVTGQDASLADDSLAGLGMRERAFAVVAPGAVWATKRWPAERFAAVVRELSQGDGLPCVLAGSAAERSLCEAVADAAGRTARAVTVAGGATLRQSAALISRAALFVGNDSGLSHLAMAVGTPTAAVFGPTDPGQFDFDGHAAVYADLACSACSFFGGARCRLGHWDCMRLVEPADVLRAARGLLAAGGGAA
jgi:heptosyltransferase-2